MIPRQKANIEPIKYKPDAKTAIVLVKGFGGTGLHTFLMINKNFQGVLSKLHFCEGRYCKLKGL